MCKMETPIPDRAKPIRRATRPREWQTGLASLARQYTDWLHPGEADSLFSHTAQGAREQLTARRYAETCAAPASGE